MHGLASVGAGACAVVFLLAVTGKIDGWSGWTQLTGDLPGPAILRVVIRFLVPLLEACVVILSLEAPVLGLAIAAAVLAIFAVAVAVLSRRLAGRECNCFGAVAPSAISGRLAIRNGVLAAVLAGLCVAAARGHAHAFSAAETLSVLTATGVVFLLAQVPHLRAATLRLTN